MYNEPSALTASITLQTKLVIRQTFVEYHWTIEGELILVIQLMSIRPFSRVTHHASPIAFQLVPYGWIRSALSSTSRHLKPHELGSTAGNSTSQKGIAEDCSLLHCCCWCCRRCCLCLSIGCRSWSWSCCCNCFAALLLRLLCLTRCFCTLPASAAFQLNVFESFFY